MIVFSCDSLATFCWRSCLLVRMDGQYRTDARRRLAVTSSSMYPIPLKLEDWIRSCRVIRQDSWTDVLHRLLRLNRRLHIVMYGKGLR